MANTANITKIVDGDRIAVFHVFIRGDGASGDFSKQVLIDPSTDLCPSPGRKPSLTIMELWTSLSGFSAILEFDYLNDETGAWAIPADHSEQICFDNFSGIKDRSNPLDGTGKLMLTTFGLLDASDCGTLIIKVRKD
jgi:hypothetical protein